MKKKKNEKKEQMTEEKLSALIDEKLEKHGAKLSKEEIKQQREALREIFVNGKPPRDAMGISVEFMNVLYTLAYNSYNGGKYEEANQIFRMLDLLEPGIPRYILGLAATYHKMENYDKAIESYFSLSVIEPDSPIAFYHIADCYEKLEMPTGVMMALGGAITRCGEDQKYAKLKGRCYVMRNKYLKEMGQEEHSLVSDEEKEEGKVDIFKQLQDEAVEKLEST